MARQIGIDLGSANTLMCLKGSGIILSSPSVIAIDQNTGKDVALGSHAKKMMGKTPNNIKVSRPIKGGIVADMDDTTLLMSRLLDKTELISFFNRPDAYVAIPYKTTEVEKRAMQTAIYEAGTKNVILVPKALASAVGAGLKVLSAKGSMIVDIGEGALEIAVISLGEIVVARSQKLGGESIDKAIINYFLNEKKMEIGALTAEKIKISVGSASPLVNRGEIQVLGRNLKNGMVLVGTATSREIYQAIKPVLTSIVHQIKLVLESTPPELVSDIHNRGITLTGGTALLPGIAEFVSAETGIKATVASKPLESVCTGLCRMMESEGALNRILNKSFY